MFVNAPQLALRSPLAVPKQPPHTTIDSAHDEIGCSDEHNAAILPWICALLAASEVLDLSVETQFTASVLLHRYRSLSGAFRVRGRTLRSDRGEDSVPSPEILAVAACLFVACKAENEPRRVRDVVSCALQLRVRVPSCEEDGSSSTNLSNTERKVPVHVLWIPDPLDAGSEIPRVARYKETQQRLIDAEQRLLRWLGFDVQVSHPHRMVVLIVQYMTAMWLDRNSVDACRYSFHQTLMDQWRLDSWQRLNSAVFCVHCLGHDVASLACASMDLELPSLSASFPRNNPASSPDVQAGWYLAVPGVSKESVTLARLDLERIAIAFA